MLTGKAIPFIVKGGRGGSSSGRRRGAAFFHQRWFTRLLGLLIVALALVAMLAPPFSGLDTLPALGAVVVALSIILEDMLFLGAGLLIGTGGVVLIVSVGAALARLIRGLF